MLRAVARSAGRRVTSWSTAPSTSTARERAGGTLAPSPISTVPGPTTSAPPSRRPSRTTHRRASPREGTRNTRGARIAIPHPRNPRPTPSPRRFAPSRRRGRRLPTHAPARPTGGTKPRGRPRAWATLDPPRTNSPRSTAEAPYRDPTIDTVNLPSVSRWDRCSSSGSAARSGSRSSASSRRGSPAAPPRNRRREKPRARRYRRRRDAARFVPGAIRSRRDSFQARFVPGAMIEPTPRCSRGASTPVLYRYESTRCVPRLISAPVPVSLPRLRGRRATRRSRAFARGHPQ